MFPVSVQIITLNEESNIQACLEAIMLNHPAEIVVIDGGSEDKTVEIARACGVRVLEPGKLGRGASRRLGYLSTNLPYVAMVDADDRIETNWLEVSLRELQSGNYSALQSSLRTLCLRNFWERGWNEYFVESVKPAREVVMVGHPALYRRDALVGARPDIGNDHEDTQLSIDFQARGFRQGIGSAISHRVVPLNASENLDKWFAYGKGYRDLVIKHPDRRLAITKHMFVTIPLSRGWPPVIRGKLAQPLFCLLMACAVILGFLAPKGRH